MPADSLQKQVGRDTQGRFRKGQSGNPVGRRPGSRNRATVIAEQLLEGQAATLVRKAVEMALDGDSVALKLCLDRILAPCRERPVEVALPPLESSSDLARVMGAVAAAAAEGQITPAEAADLAQVVETTMRALEATELRRKVFERLVKEFGLDEPEEDVEEEEEEDLWDDEEDDEPYPWEKNGKAEEEKAEEEADDQPNGADDGGWPRGSA
jgi:uncharacterized protein DUF5681